MWEKLMQLELIEKQHNFIDEMFEKYNINKWIREDTYISWFKKPLDSLTKEDKRQLYLNYACNNSKAKITFNQLAKALKKNHKFITRYANYGNPYYEDASRGKEENWFYIIDFLMVLEGAKLRAYNEVIFEYDDLELLGYLPWECEQFAENGKLMWKYVDDGYEDSDDNEDDYSYLWKKEDDDSWLDEYSTANKDYIVEHLGLFNSVTDAEITFIEWCRQLDNQEAYKKIIEHMEQYPVSLDIIRANGKDMSERRDSFLVVHPCIMVSGVTNTFTDVCKKHRIYEDFLHHYKEIPEKISEGEGNINKILTFSLEEWYCLYLLSRIQILDFINKDDNKVYSILDGYGLMEREYQVFKLLASMLGKDIK